MAQFFDAQFNPVDCACYLNLGVHQGLAALVGNLKGEFIKPALHQLCRFFENGDSLVHWQPVGAGFVQLAGGVQPGIDGGPIDQLHFANRL